MSEFNEIWNRLRSERQAAEARALEYAKYADILRQALVEISREKDENGIYTKAADYAYGELQQAEEQFSYENFTIVQQKSQETKENSGKSNTYKHQLKENYPEAKT